MQEIANGQTTSFHMDYNTGLTQVLNDGTNNYIYGNERLAQVNTVTEYFLGDALGSVRQLTNNSGVITYASAYDPYGVTAQAYGASQTAYGYTNEYADSYIKLIYLRSRWYDPNMGRFLTRDTWDGDYNRPLSLNPWNYVEGNPIVFVDPTGFIKETEAPEAQQIVNKLKMYRVYVEKDWGVWYRWHDPADASQPGLDCDWDEGGWELQELKEIKKGVVDLGNAMGYNNFIFNLGYIKVTRVEMKDANGKISSVVARGGLHILQVNNSKHSITRYATVHELAHAWDARFNWAKSKDFYVLTLKHGNAPSASIDCAIDTRHKLPGCNDVEYTYFDVLAFGSDKNMTMRQDFANSVMAYVYPEYAQLKIQKYETLDHGMYEDYLYYTDYRTTVRWAVIDSMIRSSNQTRPR